MVSFGRVYMHTYRWHAFKGLLNKSKIAVEAGVREDEDEEEHLRR